MRQNGFSWRFNLGSRTVTMGTPIAQCKGSVAGCLEARRAGPFDTIRHCTDSVPSSRQHAAVPFRALLRPSLRWGGRRPSTQGSLRVNVGVELKVRDRARLSGSGGRRRVPASTPIKKRRERGKSHRGARRSEHRGSCSQFVAELIATARLSSSKGCARSNNLFKTTTYVNSGTVDTVTRIVRFGRKAACQVS
jgi:hypothetical protein